MKSSKPAKILIVDDHPLVREGLTVRLSVEPGYEICGEAASEAEALARLKETHPDLMIVDVSLKGGSGIELIKQVKARHPTVKMLVVSGYQDSLYAERALRAGALGCVNKQESNDKLLVAIRTVLAGERFVSPEIMQRLVTYALTGDTSASPVDLLTNRELEIFRLIGHGMTTGEIATQLIVSTHTIDTHRENIKRKLNLKSGGELTRAAVQWVLENG